MIMSVDDGNRSLLTAAVESGSEDVFHAALAALGSGLSVDEVMPPVQIDQDCSHAHAHDVFSCADVARCCNETRASRDYRKKTTARRPSCRLYYNLFLQQTTVYSTFR